MERAEVRARLPNRLQFKQLPSVVLAACAELFFSSEAARTRDILIARDEK
jgi:hypothetical protein